VKWVRRAVQLFFLSLFLILLIKTKYPLDPEIPVSIFLRLSPLISLASLIYAKTFLLIFLPGLSLLFLSIFFGRFFCRLICPLGTILGWTGRLFHRRRTFSHSLKRVKYYLLIFLLASSFFTLEFVGLFDPLSLLHRTFILVIFQRINFLVLGIFFLILLVDFLGKRFWCNDLCPLGALFNLAPRLNFFKEEKPAPLNLSRRYFLGSLGLALVSPLFLKLAPFRKKDSRLIRPPGALAESEFSSLCIRCAECMKICPSKGLEPAFLEAGIEGFWTPRLVPRRGECVQYCLSCGQVCPTGAIQKLTLSQKLRLNIGRAVIDRERCLSWKEEKLCLVCMEFCPYQAIKSKDNKPVVIEDKCRGCGLCEKVCPVGPEAAIIVYRLPKTVGDKK
jgi:ferredoxin